MFSAEERLRAGVSLEQMLAEDAAAIRARQEAKAKAAAEKAKAEEAAQAEKENRQPAETYPGSSKFRNCKRLIFVKAIKKQSISYTFIDLQK